MKTQIWTFLAASTMLVALAQAAGARCPAMPQGRAIASPAFVNATVADQRPFYGLAVIFGTVTMLAHDGEGWYRTSVPTETDCLIAARGRYYTLVAGIGAESEEAGDDMRVSAEQIVVLEESALRGSLLGELRYLTWRPIAALTSSLDWLLTTINDWTGLGWGISIILLAFIVHVLFHPVIRSTRRANARISEQESLLAPRVAEIRRHYKGEEAHTRIVATYKELGISPLFRLSGVVGPMLQLPVLVAIFALLGGKDALLGASFLWIEDLSMPDRIWMLPVALPMLGDRVSVLPALMTLVALISAVASRSSKAMPKRLRAQKRNLILLALLFLVLLYPFPSAMVLYWTSANVAQLLEQTLLVRTP